MSFPFIALDSNCLTYVIDALDPGVPEPTDSVAAEKIALVRLFFYTEGTLWTVPTSEREFEAISDPVKLAKHRSWTNTIFPVYPRVENPEAVSQRADSLMNFHDKRRDCLILAEAEDAGFSALLSYDRRFLERLGGQARISLISPTTLWRSLSVPRGAPLRTQPRSDNPLAATTCWRW